MILVVAAVALLGAVPLTGGRLGALADLELRGVPVLLGGLALQVVIVSVAPGGDHGLHAAAHVLTYAMGAWFVWANRALRGMALVALGGGLNLAAIAANGGVMPASARAIATAGLEVRDGFANSAALPHARLAALGDVIPVPAGPLANVLSAGDLLLFAGAAVLLRAVCRPPRLVPGA